MLQQLENITEAEVNKLDNAAVKATYDGLKVEYLIEAYKTHITELKTKTGQSPVNSPVNSSTNNLGRSISNSETPEDIILNVYTVIILTNGTRIDEYIQKGKE